jgi:hypothetical protein
MYLSGGITQTLLANPRPDLGLPGMGTFDSRQRSAGVFVKENA